jgi:hypothetical protein
MIIAYLKFGVSECLIRNIYNGVTIFMDKI